MTFLVAITVMLSILAILGALYGTGALAIQSRQETVAERGVGVMPFNLEKTTHVFEATDNGGMEKVTADEPPDAEQISLIREHLLEEASRFGRGDFSDPAAIHGDDMPGLKELKSGAERFEFRYAELPNGAQIEFATDDPILVSALHRWFEAQLSDHGEHASPDDRQHSSHH